MFLKRNPVIKLLLPFLGGILLQWYLQPPFLFGVVLFLFGLLVALFMQCAQGHLQLWLAVAQGIAITVAAFAGGSMMTYSKDIRRHTDWFGHRYTSDAALIVSLQEPLIPKEKSYKAIASARYLIEGNKKRECSGNVILYFKKQSLSPLLQAGSLLLFRKPMQEIRNSGNPGSFDYKRYSLFHQTTHQIFLTEKDYKVLPGLDISRAAQWLLHVREYVLNAIKTNIKGKVEQGLAEAMLIGYRDDLDKNLLQSYVNTGVVHVIAVSGMHLALLYWMIHFLLQPLLKRKNYAWLYAILVLSILWGFALLASAAASIVRAAVMFSFISIGKQMKKNAATYNILAASAFCQLCYNPYWLWDVGFQLSYMAVLSIVLFYKYIYNIIFIQNQILDYVWKLAAVSIAAQLLTTPLSVYYFHQFPTYFLISNLVVVPLSSIVLLGTLMLVLIAPITALAASVGTVLNGSIWWLNSFIQIVENFPMALMKNLQINWVQTILLYVLIAGFGGWTIKKHSPSVWVALSAMLLFFSIRAFSFYTSEKQQKIIVYNVSKFSAVEFINGRNCQYVGHDALLKDPSLYNYILAPSHTLHRMQPSAYSVAGTNAHNNAFVFNHKKILVLRVSAPPPGFLKPIDADLVILSGNSKLYLPQLSAIVRTPKIVVDASVPAYKARYWLRNCDSLKISCHNVATAGAFVMHAD